VTKKRRECECRESIVTRDIRIRSTIEQHANRYQVPIARRTHERRHAVLITRIYINSTL